MSEKNEATHDEMKESSLKFKFRYLTLDYEYLMEVFIPQVFEIAQSEVPGVLYANPMCVITCSRPTNAFYQEVRQRQAEWCRQAREAFGRRNMQRASEWPIDRIYKHASRKERRYAQFLEYSIHVTGFLVIDGKLVPPQRWPKAIHGR